MLLVLGLYATLTLQPQFSEGIKKKNIPLVNYLSYLPLISRVIEMLFSYFYILGGNGIVYV